MKRFLLVLGLALILSAVSLADGLPISIKDDVVYYSQGEALDYTSSEGNDVYYVIVKTEGFVNLRRYAKQFGSYSWDGSLYSRPVNPDFGYKLIDASKDNEISAVFAHTDAERQDSIYLQINNSSGKTDSVLSFSKSSLKLNAFMQPGNDYYAKVIEDGSLSFFENNSSKLIKNLPFAAKDYLQLYSAMNPPFSLESAEKLYSISYESLKDKYPEYTLSKYSFSSDDYRNAIAVYYRYDKGYVYLKSLVCTLDKDFALNEELIDYIKIPVVNDFEDALLSTNTMFEQSYASGGIIIKNQYIDAAKLGINEKIKASALRDNALFLFAGDKNTKLYMVKQDRSGQYNVASSPYLFGENVNFDEYYQNNDQLTLYDYTNNIIAGFKKSSDGEYRISSYSINDKGFNISFFGIMDGSAEIYIGRTDGHIIGAFLKDDDIISVNFLKLPSTESQLSSLVEKGKWGVVKNDKPTSRLHLRHEADKSSTSLGKFFDGTPVKILEDKGEWFKVQLGNSLTGYMMKSFVETDDLQSVKCVFPQKLLNHGENYETKFPVYKTMDNTELSFELRAYDGYYLIGITSDEQHYIVVTPDGSIGYIESKYLWDGNG